MTRPKQRDLPIRAARLAIRHLVETHLAEITPKEIAKLLRITETSVVRDYIDCVSPLMSDITALCEPLEVDFGIALRDSTGKEVTVYPSNNFGVGEQEMQAMPAKKEETNK